MVCTLFCSVQRSFESQSNLFSQFGKFVELFGESTEELVKLGNVHENDFVVMHPGV